MNNPVVVIGIDSLDPNVLLSHREELPNFSKIMGESPTLKSKSVYPVDTIPAWASIFTGLNPGNHGLLYVYDIFDPNLSDLNKLDKNGVIGKTFWDIASASGLRSVIVYPVLMYPAWKINGVMISKAPIDRRIDQICTVRDISVYPEEIRSKYDIPLTMEDLWGGYPGESHLKEWADKGLEIVKREKEIAIKLFEKEECDLFFAYLSLDIVQHRLWRYFDPEDPMYPGPNKFEHVILDYYKLMDSIIGEFIAIKPDARFLIISDHGHKTRPYSTININEYLRREGFLHAKKQRMSSAGKSVLSIASALHMEHLLLKMVSRSKTLTKKGKAIYSSSDALEKGNSIAMLSSFAGIKSYSHGGIEINRQIVREDEYEKTVRTIIDSLMKLTTPDGRQVIKWAYPRGEVYEGKYTDKIFPDILFEMISEYGVGWDVHKGLYGHSSDHRVASGGHAIDAVMLSYNIRNKPCKENINIMDLSPTILGLMGIDTPGLNQNGRDIYNTG